MVVKINNDNITIGNTRLSSYHGLTNFGKNYKKSSQRTDYKNDFDPELKSDFIFMPWNNVPRPILS